MEEMNIKANAKVNLSLDILRKRPDGYHEISTIMHSTALSDNLFIKKVYKPNYLKLVSNLGWLPTDNRNLAYKATAYLKEKFGIEVGIFLNLTKAIPVSAGLGGGSANCAAVLIGLRDMFNLPLSNNDLVKLGARFGADVPFCILGGAAYATGIGEQLKPLVTMPPCHILLIKPQVIISTEEIFKAYDDSAVTQRPDTERMLYGLQSSNLTGICEGMANVLESVTATQYPIINKLKEGLMEQDALAAMMTGSGPTVFGIFSSFDRAVQASEIIKKKYSDINEIIITKPIC